MRKSRFLILSSVAACLTLPALNAAKAQCAALPYQLSNGQIADATQVMSNFDTVLGCANNKGTVNNGTAGQIAWYAAAGNSVSGQSLSGLLDSALGSTQGSIPYRGASSWAALPPGAAGYVLQSGGASANPSWAPSSGGGIGINTIVAAGISSSGPTVAFPGVPVISRPALASFTWVNQASATAGEYTNGPLVLQTTQNTAGANGINALTKSVIAPSWTVTIQYAQGNHTANLGGSVTDLAGLIVYNSVTGRINICGIGAGGSVNVWTYNSTTSLNSYIASKNILVNPASIWLRAQYVSSTTTLTFSYSLDGFTWESFYSTNAPFVDVPTGYGIAVGTLNNTSGYVLSAQLHGRDLAVTTRVGRRPMLGRNIQPGATLIGVNLGCFTLLLTLRRARSGRLEGWGPVAVIRSNGSRTASTVPHPSRRALGRAPQGEEEGERRKLKPMGTALAAVSALALLGTAIPNGAEANVSYGYDQLGRVTTALYDNGLCIVYSYDANGNRTSQTNYGPPQTPPALWGTPTSWGNFTWSSAPQWPVWGSGSVWGCFKWTPQ